MMVAAMVVAAGGGQRAAGGIFPSNCLWDGISRTVYAPIAMDSDTANHKEREWNKAYDRMPQQKNDDGTDNNTDCGVMVCLAMRMTRSQRYADMVYASNYAKARVLTRMLLQAYGPPVRTNRRNRTVAGPQRLRLNI